MEAGTLISGTCLILALPAVASAQLTGGYAPDTWNVSGVGIGPSDVEFAADGSSVTITGPDGAVGQTDVTHVVLASGLWSFDWVYTSADTECFDNGYYLLNGTVVFLACATVFEPPHTGSESIAVVAGDIVGWRVDSTDGIFGPGALTVTTFQIPTPATFGVFALAALVGTRRRRRFRSRSPTLCENAFVQPLHRWTSIVALSRMEATP